MPYELNVSFYKDKIMMPFGNYNKNKKEVLIKYKNLTDFLKKYDPTKLITQLTLTYLFYPAKPGEEFKPEYDEIHKWSRWIEFISGYLVSFDYPNDRKLFVDGKVLTKLEKLIEKYFNLITRYYHSLPIVEGEEKEHNLLLQIKFYTLYVRGDTFPKNQIFQAKELYTLHDDYFISKFGFTINDAIEIYESIINEYVERIQRILIVCRDESKELTNKQIEQDPTLRKHEKKLETSNFCKLFFCMSDEHLSFDLDQLIAFSGMKKDKCLAFLNRLSQPFGYKNTKFPDTYTDPITAPFDYNTLYERPIIKNNDRYFLPNSSLFPTVLLNTFHYDIIKDETYNDIYNDSRGKWLERRTAKAFKNIFNEKNVILNPLYLNQEELADVLVLYDRKIFIIQCKSKSLRFESKIGINYRHLKDDINKGIKSSFEQSIKAREYLLNKKMPEILYGNRKITIDTDQVSDIFLVSVTFGYYQSLLTKLTYLDTTLNLFQNNDFPWAISISDLEVITEIFDIPSEFIHYTKQRLKIEKEKFDLMADEVDLLNFYLEQGLNFNRGDFRKYNNIYLTGFSTEIDNYFFDRYNLCKNVMKPKRKYPDDFINYLKEIEDFNYAYKSDCIDKLLMLDYNQQKSFLDGINKIKNSELKEKKFKAVNLHDSDQDIGFSFLLCTANKNIEKIYQQVFTYINLLKYKTKCTNWIGLGLDINSMNLVDISVYLSFEWYEDDVIDKMANDNIHYIKS